MNPTETTKASGSSNRIGAAGTAVETTAVMMFNGLQQFITQKPRLIAISMRRPRTARSADDPARFARPTIAASRSIAP
jgi:hypothetical protein